jgi:hypothetical protein
MAPANSTSEDGQEGPILRAVMIHSIALAQLVGVIVGYTPTCFRGLCR